MRYNAASPPTVRPGGIGTLFRRTRIPHSQSISFGCMIGGPGDRRDHEVGEKNRQDIQRPRGPPYVPFTAGAQPPSGPRYALRGRPSLDGHIRLLPFFSCTDPDPRGKLVIPLIVLAIFEVREVMTHDGSKEAGRGDEVAPRRARASPASRCPS